MILLRKEGAETNGRAGATNIWCSSASTTKELVHQENTKRKCCEDRKHADKNMPILRHQVHVHNCFTSTYSPTKSTNQRLGAVFTKVMNSLFALYS